MIRLSILPLLALLGSVLNGCAEESLTVDEYAYWVCGGGMAGLLEERMIEEFGELREIRSFTYDDALRIVD